MGARPSARRQLVVHLISGSTSAGRMQAGCGFWYFLLDEHVSTRDRAHGVTAPPLKLTDLTHGEGEPVVVAVVAVDVAVVGIDVPRGAERPPASPST